MSASAAGPGDPPATAGGRIEFGTSHSFGGFTIGTGLIEVDSSGWISRTGIFAGFLDPFVGVGIDATPNHLACTGEPISICVNISSGASSGEWGFGLREGGARTGSLRASRASVRC